MSEINRQRIHNAGARNKNERCQNTFILARGTQRIVLLCENEMIPVSV